MLPKKLVFHLVTSKIFWIGAPLLIQEIVKCGHYISVFDENMVPSYKRLLDCDVYVDMSAITKKSFYLSIKREYERRILSGLRTPLMVDPPEAIMDSLDKRRTHKIFPDIVPESHNLNGKNNVKVINDFMADKFVVVKKPEGWWGTDVERLTPQQALKKHDASRDLIVQKYVPFEKGVGRIVTLNYNNDFEVVCAYLRIPNSWRTGTDVKYTCVRELVTNDLHKFAQSVSSRCGLYLNGIDYIYSNGKYVLLEVNAVPAMKEPLDAFGVDIPKKLLSHIERNVPVRQ